MIKSLFPFILFPYVLLIDFHAFISCGIISEMPVAAFFIYTVIILVNVVEVIFMIAGFVKICRTLVFASDKRLLSRVLVVKFLHIPFFLYMFIVGFTTFALPMGFILTIICWLSDCMTIGVTGALVAIALLQDVKNGDMERRYAVIHGIMAFIFCVDIIDAIYIKLKIRKQV